MPNRHRQRVEWCSLFGAAVVACVGATGLIGWMFEVPALKSILPELATMKANTASAFLIAGLSRLCLAGIAYRWTISSRFLAVVLIALGAATLAEYALDVNIGIDEVLFEETGSTSPYPGRMAAATATGILFAGLALVNLRAGPRRVRFALWCAVPVLVVGWLGVMGYAYDVSALYQIGPYSSMAVHTAGALVVLGLSILGSEPAAGLVGIAISDTAGGAVARGLVPVVPVLFFVLGWAWLAGERAGLYDISFGFSLMVMSATVLGVVMLAQYASLLHAADLARRRAEADALALTEFLADRKFEALVDSAPDAMVIVNEAGNIDLVNAQVERLFGYRREELLGQPVEVLLPERFRSRHVTHREGFVLDPRSRPMGPSLDLHARRKDGSEFQVEVSISPLETKEGLFVSSSIRDVTARRRAEESEARLAAIVASANDAIYSTTPDGTIRTWNRGAELIFGYSGDEIAGRSVVDLVPEHLRDEEARIQEQLRKGESVESYETVRRRKDGIMLDVALTVSPVRDVRGAVIAVSTIGRDVTDRKEAERRLRTSLEEKETLLREIHHRVKNNLAVISSLFYLESTYARESETVRLLQEARDRVLSMALVHETLYRSDSFARLKFGEYVEALLTNLLGTYATMKTKVVLHAEVGAVSMNIDSAIPCALIVNELVTNSLKHAFPDGRTGEIHVSVKQIAGRYVLRVRDTGIGIPAGVDPATARSLGLRLVRSLTTQLGGEFSIQKADPGSESVLSFPGDENGRQS